MYQKGHAGHPKAGRPPRMKIDVNAILEEKGCNPFQILADLALNGRSEKIRSKAASELAQYIAPKLRAIEISPDSTNPFTVTLNLKDATLTR